VIANYPSSVVSDLVGGTADARALIEAVREGFPHRAFEEVRAVTGVSSRELAALMGISERTLTNRKRSGRFTPQESDHLLRIARIYARAHDYFGSREQAGAWLKKPALALGDETPLSLLDTELGAEQVMTLLGQLEYGVLP
jgi:putative toxin-antitoxin system antitoxin component (TIGR02293 family)